MFKIYFVKIFFLILFFLSIFRLIYVSFFYKKNIYEYINNQYLESVVFRKLRSKIFDRNGLKITENKRINTACCSPLKINREEFYDFLKENYYESYLKILKKKDKYFSYIKRKVNKNEEDFLKENFPEEIFFIKEYERFYPYEFLSPLIGFVDTDMKGISGLEFYLNNFIEGFEINKKNKIFDSEDLNETLENKAVNTTIDSLLSYKIFKIIKNAKEKFDSEYVSAIVMDSENGDILSIVQYPYFNLSKDKVNNFEFQKLLPVTDAYEMGSVIKAFCALALIDEKIVEYDELIDCNNSKKTFLNGVKVNTWKASGEIPFWKVIRESNNIGIAKVAIKLNKKLYDHYLKMGFSKKTGIEFPGEASGYINTPNNWSNQSIISLSYGYEISTTLLQLVSAWSIFSENGTRIIPRILLSTPVRKIENLYEKYTVNKVKNILEYSEERLSKNFFKNFKNLKIYGKTGTANILEDGVYNNKKNAYVFVGHVEKEDKRRIIAVYVRLSNKKNVYSSTVAQPLFFEIIKKLDIFL